MIVIGFLLFICQESLVNDVHADANLQVSLKKELRLGGPDAPDNQMFSATVRVAATTDGVMYVVDPGGHVVSVFGVDGAHLRSFGKHGPGPGEFDEPVAISLDQSGNPVVFDTGHKKMIVFDPNGAHQRDIRFESGIQGIVAKPILFPNGNISFVSYQNDENFQFAYVLALYDPAMKPIEEIYKVTTPQQDWSQAGSPAFWVGFLKDQFEVVGRGLPIQVGLGDKMVTGMSTEYEGQIRGQDGKTLKKYVKKFKPRAMSDEAKRAICDDIWQNLAGNPALTAQLTQAVFERALADADFPPRLPPMFAMASLAKGFAVLSNYDLIAKKGVLDLFNESGKLIAQTDYDGNHQFMTGAGSYLYVVGPDDEDYVVIDRYRVTGL